MEQAAAVFDVFFYWVVPSLGFGMMLVATALWRRCEVLEKQLHCEQRLNEELLAERELGTDDA